MTFHHITYHQLSILPSKVQSTLSNLPSYTSLITPTLPTNVINVFTVSSISKMGILLKSTKISTPLDSIPLSLLYEFTESLSTPLNNIFCLSLESGTFPTSYTKFTHYTPPYLTKL